MTDTHRIAASTAPRTSRIPGSPEWCYQTMNLMKMSYQHLNINHKDFAEYLTELREHQAWEKVPIECPYGSEEKMLLAELGKRTDEIKAQLKAARTAARKARHEAISAKNKENPSRQGQRSDLVYNNEKDVHKVRPSGNSAAAFDRRLRKDRPDIHARVLTGELTPFGGMVEAGFRKPRPKRVKPTPYERMQKLAVQLTKAEIRKFRQWLDKEFGS